MSELRGSFIEMDMHNVGITMGALIRDVMLLDDERGLALSEKLREIRQIVNDMKKE